MAKCVCLLRYVCLYLSALFCLSLRPFLCSLEQYEKGVEGFYAQEAFLAPRPHFPRQHHHFQDILSAGQFPPWHVCTECKGRSFCWQVYS